MFHKKYKGIVLTPADFLEREWIDEITSSGLNLLGLHSGGGKSHDVIEKLEFTGTEAFRTRLVNSGLDWEYELHTPYNLMPRELFETHPEYFPEQLRVRERDKDGNWCVSSPGALQIVTENAKKLKAMLPSSTNRYFFWGKDSLLYDWCNCDKCASLTAPDQNLLTSNTIARKLGPEAQVCYLAYNSTIEAPRNIRPEENVFAEFAPFYRSYKHSLCDSRSVVNRKYVEYLLDLMKIFSAERIHILEYWLDSSLFGFESEVAHRASFDRKIARADIAFYASLGIRSITTFAVRMDGAYRRNYGNREFLEYAEILNQIY